MTVLATIVGFWLLWWGVSRLRPPKTAERQLQLTSGGARQPAPDDVSRLRERFATTDMSVEEFETEVAGALERPSRPTEPAQYSERIEINIYGAPERHELHLHL